MFVTALYTLALSVCATPTAGGPPPTCVTVIFSGFASSDLCEAAARPIRDYVENNVRINVDIGRYLAPSPSDLEDALEQSRLEAKCAEDVDVGVEEAPAFRP